MTGERKVSRAKSGCQRQIESRACHRHAAGRVQAILDRYKPIDPAVRAAEYRKEGWATFNPEAPPYRPSEAEIERIRRVE